MEVALYARVSTPNQQQEGTITSQIQSLHLYRRQQGWSLLPTHEYIDEGASGARLDRPALDRLRDCAQRGEFDAVVVLSPDRLARNYAHQWLLIEEFEKLQVQWIFLQNPFGDTPQGKLLTQMQGMMAEYERAQIHERTRRGRLEKARRGEFMPWAYHCYGYRYLPKRHGCVPQVVINPEEAAVVRHLYQAVVEEQLSCRQLTRRLNEACTPTPSRKSRVWHPATVRNILTNRVYTGTARYNYRQPALPKYRQGADAQLHAQKTGRSYRPTSEWIESEAPAIISVELFEKAQLQLQRNAEVARKMYQPTSRRYLLRTLVKCGECGLGMVAAHRRSVCKKYEYLYYDCKGRFPLTCGRVTKCASRHVRADRLDAVVWNSLCELLKMPALLPQLHQTWAQSKQNDLTTLTTQQSQLLQRRQRLERQSQRRLDAYQAEIVTLSELQLRRQKLTTELHHLDRELQQFAHTHQQTLHWQAVIAHVAHFRHLLGENLDRLSFADRQTVAQCLIKKVVVTGERVAIYYILPFDQPPQVYNSSNQPPEGTPGHFYRLRLVDLDPGPQAVPTRLARCRGQIGQQQPGIGIAFFPPCQQGAIESAARSDKGRSCSRPLRTRLRDQTAQGLIPSAGGRAKGAAPIDAQQRMPAQADDAPEQPTRIQSPIGQDEHEEAPRHGNAHLTQHAQPLPPPRVFLPGGQDRPRHGNGTTSIEPAEDQNHKALAQGRRVQSQRQLRSLPPPHPPCQQRRKAALDLQLLARPAAFGLSLVAKLPQLLTHGIGLALQALRQNQTDRAQGARPRQDQPQTPQGQHRRLGLAQVGQGCGDHLGPLVHCSSARHRLPPGGWSVSQYPSMSCREPVLPSPLRAFARYDSLKTLPLKGWRTGDG